MTIKSPMPKATEGVCVPVMFGHMELKVNPPTKASAMKIKLFVCPVLFALGRALKDKYAVHGT